MGGYDAVTVTKLEEVLSAVPVLNTTTGETADQDWRTGSAQREVTFTKTYSRVQLRNNYLFPVRVVLYCCQPNADTSITPKTAITNGLNDEGALTTTSWGVFPNDSHQFKDLWTITKRLERVLRPGKQMMMTQSMGEFQYDPSFTDSHSLAFQSRFAGHAYLIRVEGTIAHGVTSGQGTSDARVDCIFETHFTVKYEAGGDINTVKVLNNMDLVGAATVAEVDVEKNIAK